MMVASQQDGGVAVALAFKSAPGLRWWEGETGRAHPLEGLRGSGLADRFCAWAGRSGARSIFSVIALDGMVRLEDLPLGACMIVLGVRRQAGQRRVLWSAAVPAGGPTATLRLEVAALMAMGDGELHLHLLAAHPAERNAIVTDLGFTRLDGADADVPWQG